MAMNITEIKFGSGRTATGNLLYQYDYGQILLFPDLDLPEAYEVHFASQFDAQTITMIGDADGVLVPDEMLLTAGHIKVFIFLHEGEDDGETEYKALIPVIGRPEPSDLEPTPVQQDAITQAIAALNTAVAESSQSASDAAESADAAAQSAQDAQASASEAQESAESAQDSATGASTSEANASRYASQAQQSATSASESAQSASTSADRAEQAAADAGYMFFYIDENGDLIYQRTSNTQVDFYLSDGDLYVRTSA